jgi:hypothetical protein
MIDNTLLNSAMEIFSSGFTNWTEVGSPTVTQETGIVRIPNGNSAKIVASGAAGQLTQAPNIPINSITDRFARAKFWVYATAESAARVRLDWDGSSFASSDYHSGKDQWELLEASDNVPTTATQIKTILEVADGNTGYFGPGYQSNGSISKYLIPSSITKGPNSVDQQMYEDRPEGPYAPLHQAVTGRLLRLRGIGNLSEPATDAATTEVDGIRAELIAAKACEILFQRTKGDRGTESHTSAFWTNRVKELLGQPGVPMGAMGARSSGGFFHFEEDSDGKHIILDQ